MRLLAMRHGHFSPTNGGKPTPESLKRFLKKAPTTKIVVSSPAPRCLMLAERFCRKTGARLIVLPEFNSLRTTRHPSIFGGWLYELLHRWQFFNHLCLVLWWIGLPIFTEGPVQFLERTRLGLKKLRVSTSTADEAFLVCHQETIIALRMIVNKESPIKALSFKRRIRHLQIVSFKIK